MVWAGSVTSSRLADCGGNLKWTVQGSKSAAVPGFDGIVVVLGADCLKRGRQRVDTALRTDLVDLKEFEPLTSSMAWKNNQSLVVILAQNKRLSKMRRGLRWTPPASFLASGTPGLHTSGWHSRASARAAAGCGDCCLLEQTIKNFSIRIIPMELVYTLPSAPFGLPLLRP